MSSSLSSTVLEKIDQYLLDPTALANKVKKLQGREGYRLRFGDYRVILGDFGGSFNFGSWKARAIFQ
jgi:mRNA-degrading endonuclease RelE of RelBE toxin-antitoxin system